MPIVDSPNHSSYQYMNVLFGPRDHITPTLISLHGLPARQRITYKLCTMMHSVYYGEIHRIYLTLLLQSHMYQAVPTYVRRKTETTTVHVYSLDSVGVHSRCLDLMPGTVCLVR